MEKNLKIKFTLYSICLYLLTASFQASNAQEACVYHNEFYRTTLSAPGFPTLQGAIDFECGRQNCQPGYVAWHPGEEDREGVLWCLSCASRPNEPETAFGLLRKGACSAGFALVNGECELVQEDFPPHCEPEKTPPNCGVGNPCNPITGHKFQTETDITGKHPLKRFYNSGYTIDVGFGKGWRSSFHKSLLVSHNRVDLYIVEAYGNGEPWVKASNNWQGDADTDYAITQQIDSGFTQSYTIELENGGSEVYDSSGYLQKAIDAQGDETVYEYNNNDQLIKVTDEYGQAIQFSYDSNGHITLVTDASGAEYRYEYDTNNNLTAVVYPDLTPSNVNDNPRRTYHYENSQFPNHLTGITDENGDRFASYAYDAQGRAVTTEHAQTSNSVGQERFQLSY